MKKALPLVIALAVIAAVAVILALTVLRPNDAVEPSPSASPSETPTVETQSPSPTSEPSATPDENGNLEYVVDVSGTTYSLTVDGELFDAAETSTGRRFTLKTDADVFIETAFIPDKTALAAAPAFLDQYIDYLELETSGKNYVPGTEIAGETVVGYRGDEACSAWLVDIDGGVVAVAISYSGEIPQAVYDALGTFTIEK